jgi:hypothetical protein
MDSKLVNDLANELINYKIGVEAMILGCDELDAGAVMYRVDSSGRVRNHSDIGFLSIGEGGVHSSAHFMFESYSHTNTYFRALYQTFKAKKRAEVAPGVGELTDMFLITNNGAAPIARELIDALEKIHREDVRRAKERPAEVERELQALHSEPSP